MFGGISWYWVVQLWCYVFNDFCQYSLYGVGKDWLISYDDLEDYYYQVEVIVGVGGLFESGLLCKYFFLMEWVLVLWLQ